MFDLSVDGVGYSTTGGFVDDIADQLDAFKEQIVSGEIERPDGSLIRRSTDRSAIDR